MDNFTNCASSSQKMPTISELKTLMRGLMRGVKRMPPAPKIYCHPDNKQLLIDKLRSHCKLAPPADIPPFSPLSGIPFSSLIETSPCIPRTRKTGRVIFPEDKFVEYGPEDEEWALALGFGEEETEPVVFME